VDKTQNLRITLKLFLMITVRYYSIPQSIKSAQIIAFQSRFCKTLLNNIRHLTVVDVIYAQALLINRHKYFPPYHMKVVVGNISCLENTPPTTIVKSSYLPFYSIENSIVYVAQKNRKVIILLNI